MKYFKPLILILLSLFLILQVFSQNNETDSLKTLLKTDLKDTAFVNTALDLAWNYMYSETDSAVKYANIALQVAKALILTPYRNPKKREWAWVMCEAASIQSAENALSKAKRAKVSLQGLRWR